MQADIAQAGELLPGQGGHNEYIANKLYSELEPEYHKNLDIHCYVAKDQVWAHTQYF